MRLGGVYCCSKPLLSMLAQAAKLTKQALGPTSAQVSKAWRDVAPVQQACTASLHACFFQHLAVNVSALESCVWSQGLDGKSERVHACANSNTRFIWDVALGFCCVH